MGALPSLSPRDRAPWGAGLAPRPCCRLRLVGVGRHRPSLAWAVGLLAQSSELVATAICSHGLLVLVAAVGSSAHAGVSQPPQVAPTPRS